jgi:hypothetical protein
MNRRLLALACALAAATAGLGAGIVTANEKIGLVTVVADSGKAANGLTPADFTVTEGKDAVQVVEAVPAKDPLSVVLLADTALPSDGRAATPELRKALNAFVAAVLAGEPNAQIALYQVSNAAVPVKEFTADRADLDAGINLIASGAPSGSAMLEGVVTAAKKVGERPAPRRAIVAVGMGTEEGTQLQPKAVADAVRQSGATLWVVSLQGVAESQLTNRDAVWTRATEDTGGLRQNIVQAAQLEARLQSVANSLLSQYYLKMVRKGDSAVKGLKGQTAQHSQVLFTHWMR